jgi:hypothetical protein
MFKIIENKFSECSFRLIQLEFDEEYRGAVDNCQQICCVAHVQSKLIVTIIS